MLKSAQATTREVLEEILAERILVLDGAMGTMIYAHEPTEEDYRGERFRNHPVPLKNCTEVLVLTQPRDDRGHPPRLPRGRRRHHRDRHVQLPTAISMAEFGLEDHVVELNQAAAEIARRAADDYDPARPRQAPVRRRQHRADQQDSSRSASDVDDPALPRRHLRPDGRRLLPSRSDGLVDGRRRHPPARDVVRHARHEGVPVRHRQVLRATRRPRCR